MSNFGRILSVEEITSKKVLPVPGYEDLYRIASDGSVFRVKNHRFIKATNGFVSLRKDGKNISFRLEELVYTLFVDSGWDRLHKIIHVDGNPDNCSAENLTCKSRIPDLPGEIWRSFAVKYEVSSFGRVRYVPDDILCTARKTNDNCMYVINIDSTSYRLDDLVATVFLGRRDDQSVYHVDGDMNNCSLDNLSLEFCIDSEPGELWKDVSGYEGRYKVSSHGRVFSIPRKEPRGNSYVTKGGWFLKAGEDEDGYLKVVLVDSTRTLGIFVHRLVALNFIENPHPDYYNCVNHKDGNKQNNHAENLEWCTNQMNVDHSMITGLRDNVAYNNPRAYTTIVETSDGVRHRFESIQQASYYLDVDPELLRLYIHGEYESCSGLDPTIRVYITSKDDYNNVVCEPMIKYMSSGYKSMNR